MSNIIIEYWNDRGDVGNILYQTVNGDFRNRLIFPEQIEAHQIAYEIEEVEEEDVRGIPEVVYQIYRKTFTINYLCDYGIADALSILKLHDSIRIKLKGLAFEEVKSIDVSIDTDQAPLQAEVQVTFSFEWVYKSLCGHELQKPLIRDVIAFEDDGFGEPGGTGTDPVDNSSAMLKVGDAATEYRTFILFESIYLANTQAVSYAILDLYAGAAETGGALRIHGVVSANVAAAQINADLVDSVLTTKYVDWNPPDAAEFDKMTTPNLNEIISEIISHPGWESGNNLEIIIIPQAGSAQRTFKSLDAGYPSRITIISEDISSNPVWRNYSDDYEQSYN